MLVAAEGRLYRFYPDGSKVNLCALTGPYEEKLFYAAVDDAVYISSRHWMGILDPAENTVGTWGMMPRFWMSCMYFNCTSMACAGVGGLCTYQQ